MLIFCISSEKSFWPTTLVEVVQILSAIGILFAAGTYYFNRKIKRAEWLKSLYEKFYENTTYKDVRKWIDWDEIQSELSVDANHDKEEKFADFLNFFEFIAILESEGQIREKEVRNMFSYYLRLINKSEFCKKYVQDNGYRNLFKLLNKDW